MYSPLLLAAGLNNYPAKIAQKVKDDENTNDTFRSKLKKNTFEQTGTFNSSFWSKFPSRRNG